MLLRARGGTRSREEMAEAAAPEPPPPPPPPDDDEDDEERLCRFCLCGDDDEPDPDDRELLSATLGRPSTAPNRACRLPLRLRCRPSARSPRVAVRVHGRHKDPETIRRAVAQKFNSLFKEGAARKVKREQLVREHEV